MALKLGKKVWPKNIDQMEVISFKIIELWAFHPERVCKTASAIGWDQKPISQPPQDASSYFLLSPTTINSSLFSLPGKHLLFL